MPPASVPPPGAVAPPVPELVRPLPLDAQHVDVLRAVGIDELCKWISAGSNQKQIAQSLGVSEFAVLRFMCSEENMPKTIVARSYAAQHWDFEAERVMLSLSRDATTGDIARARELAHHYRWRAKAFNRNLYGDKQEIEHKGGITVSMSKDDLGVV